MKFNVVCDSSADLYRQEAEEMAVTVVPFYVSMDGEHYLKEGKEIAVEDFYREMLDNKDCFPKTSMPSLEDYIDVFTSFCQRGEKVLCICLKEKFSGSYNCALNAKNAVLEEFPEGEIEVLDSGAATALEGVVVREAVRLRDKGIDLKEAVCLLQEIIPTGRIFFTTEDLKYLEHGGRIGKASCKVGTVLNLKPILKFSDGELGKSEICRGRKNSLKKIEDEFFSYVRENNIDMSKYYFGTGIGIDNPDYIPFTEEIAKRMEEENIKPYTWIKITIGATIGVHTGPYPIGLGFMKKCDI